MASCIHGLWNNILKIQIDSHSGGKFVNNLQDVVIFSFQIKMALWIASARAQFMRVRTKYFRRISGLKPRGFIYKLEKNKHSRMITKSPLVQNIIM